MSAFYNGLRIDDVSGVTLVGSFPKVMIRLKNGSEITYMCDSDEEKRQFQQEWQKAIEVRDKELHQRALEIAKANAPVIYFGTSEL